MCYLAQFGCSSLKSVVVDKEPPKLGSAGAPAALWDGAVVTPKTSPLPICVTESNLVVLRQRVYA